MLMRSLLILVLTQLLLSQLYSQNSQDDVVYLNNGTFFRGKIVELIPGEFLKISLIGKDTLEIQMKDVKLIRKENKPEGIFKNYEHGVKTSGYTFIGEFNFGLGMLEGLERYKDTAQGQYSVMLTVFNGITITPFIQLGIGAGLDMWKNRIFLPIYLDLRVNIIKKVNSPFLYFNTGYSLGWITGVKGVDLGGAIAAIGAGAKFRISTKQIMVLSLGYRFQQTRQWQVNNRVENKATRDAHFINLKMGLIF
jgi:hypothetical protein